MQQRSTRSVLAVLMRMKAGVQRDSVDKLLLWLINMNAQAEARVFNKLEEVCFPNLLVADERRSPNVVTFTWILVCSAADVALFSCPSDSSRCAGGYFESSLPYVVLPAIRTNSVETELTRLLPGINPDFTDWFLFEMSCYMISLNT